MHQDLYQKALSLIHRTELFEFGEDGTIFKLKVELLKKPRLENVSSLIILGVAVEYLLKAFLLSYEIDIFKKFNAPEILDMNDGTTFISLSCKDNPRLKQLLDQNKIFRANEIDTKSFESLIQLVDQTSLDSKKKNVLKNGLDKFRVHIRNKFIHLDVGILQISSENFNGIYIPAFNILIHDFKVER